MKSSQALTSRQQVLEYIRSQHAVTSLDISRALGMTAANARHHLDILSSQGVVEMIGEKQCVKRGRPARVYGLSEVVQGHNLARLAIAVLSEIVPNKAPHGMSISDRRLEPGVVQRLAKRLSEDPLKANNLAPPEMVYSPGRNAKLKNEPGQESGIETKNKGLPLAHRFFKAVQQLNALHYEARWEAHRSAPRVIFNNCPYQGVVEIFPDLCAIDAALLTELTGLPAHQIEKLALDAKGGKFCAFNLLQTRFPDTG